MNPNDKDRIDKLEKGLYSRAHPKEYTDERATISQKEVTAAPAWTGERVEDLVKRTREEREHMHNKVVKRILIGSIAFFVLALGIGFYMFFGGGNSVSSNNINIVVSGPTSVAGGEELPLEITLQNQNSADLEGATLSVEYPPGTKVAGDLKTALPRQQISIGTIPARGQVTETLTSVLFGEKDSIQNIKITLQYRIAGTSAVFYKDKNYDIGIASSPIIVSPEYPSEVDSNQDFQMVLHVTSNSTEVLHNILLQAQYPFGFTFESANPTPTEDTNSWSLGDLGPGDSRTITIKGSIQGQDQEQRTFQFTAGVADDKNQNTIGTTLTSIQNSLTIKKSALDLSVNVGSNTNTNYVATPGLSVPVNISWTNNLPSQIIDAQITVKLTGGALDRSSVAAASGGFYRSVDNTVVWDKTNNPDFASIGPGDKGTVSFSLAPLSTFPAGTKNPDIGIAVTLSGSQLSSNNTPQNLTTSVTQDVKVSSALNLSARLVRSVGPFENSGPIPPKADKPTSYTVIWNITNPLNDINNTTVSATLPSYVSWNNLTSPGSEALTYDSLSNTVTWNAGTVTAGTGFGSPPRTAYFQVTFLPSLGQVGTTPDLVEGAKITGTDAFTNRSLSQTLDTLTTRTSTDPQFKEGDETVVK